LKYDIDVDIDITCALSQCIAIPEAQPQAPLHFIVIPKQPIGDICHCTEADKRVHN